MVPCNKNNGITSNDVHMHAEKRPEQTIVGITVFSPSNKKLKSLSLPRLEKY
jgi:hypothetical protein